MTEWRLRLPLRRRDEPLTPSTIPQIASLIDDEADSAVTFEALWDAMELGRRTGTVATSGIAERYFGSLGQEERMRLLSRWRERQGLPSPAEVEAQERAAAAAERARRVAAHNRGELRLAIAPGGAIIDLGERAVLEERERIRAEALAARRAAQVAERADEAALRRANEEARAEEMRRRTAPGFPTP